MKKAIVAGIVGLGLTFGIAGTAPAETLHRNGASTVTIKPVGAPAGANVTKARVTVKQGKKTVARNKNFYKAKKGTYKVTSTITYRARTSYVPNGTGAEAFTGTCRVTTEPYVVDDRTEQTEWDWEWNWASDRYVPVEWYVSGQATIQYSGTCTDWYWTRDRNGYLTTTSVTWDTTWLDDEDISGTHRYMGVGWTDEPALYTDYVEGDVAYSVTPESMPTVPTYAASLTTKQSTRTVVVR